MPEIAFVDGKCTPIDQAAVPVEDRGVQFGDAVYEVIAGFNGRLFCLEEHLDRLCRSMAALDFPPLERDQIRHDIEAAFERAALPAAAVYLQISRGDAPRQHAIPAAARLRTVMTVRAIRPLPAELRQNGVALITVADMRWGRCDIKTVQLLPNILAKKEATAAGAFDAVFLGTDGCVREATSSNLFCVVSGRLLTHPLTRHILGGVTRIAVLRLCRELKIPAAECFMPQATLRQAEEIFITGTLTQVLPVVRIDGHPVGSGRPGPVTRRLARALADWIGTERPLAKSPR